MNKSQLNKMDEIIEYYFENHECLDLNEVEEIEEIRDEINQELRMIRREK